MAGFNRILRPPHYCECAVAASGTVFTLALRGHKNVQLYGGSLAE